MAETGDSTIREEGKTQAVVRGGDEQRQELEEARPVQRLRDK